MRHSFVGHLTPIVIAAALCFSLAGAGDRAVSERTPARAVAVTFDDLPGPSAGMTAKQSVVFRYVTRLMFHIPDATIHTLRDLMEPGGADRYREHIQRGGPPNMDHWPRIDLHLHATHYRLEGARPEMTVANIVRRATGSSKA